MVYKTAVNQPDRLFVSSNDDETSILTSTYNRFDIRLRTPVLQAKRAQLLRASIPNASASFPDYGLLFFYRRLATATTARNASGLQCVRLMPSNWVSFNSTTYNMPVNRVFSNPADLVVALNQAANNDSTTLNTMYTAGDVSFSYDPSTKKISMTGTNTSLFYEPIGYASPWLTYAFTFDPANPAIRIPNFNYTGTGVANTTVPQTISQYNMNLRLGYSQPNDGTGASQYCRLGGNPITFDGYPNLIYTSCYNVYSNFVAGSSLGSNGKRDLLAAIPCETAQLTMTNYTARNLNWLLKVPDSITSLSVYVEDENDQPVNFPDNVILSFEVGLKFDE